jgi:hypothetical protein
VEIKREWKRKKVEMAAFGMVDGSMFHIHRGPVDMGVTNTTQPREMSDRTGVNSHEDGFRRGGRERERERERMK